jgi:hypothetical protein
MVVPSSQELTQAKQRISQAISVGAPAYNAGDIQRCATLYVEAAKEIAPLVPSSLRAKLLREVDEDEIADRENNETKYDAKAWALRRVFDSIMDYQLPIIPQVEISGENSITYEPFTPSQLGLQPPVGVMDSVMGGMSNGSWISKTNTFFGETSLVNNGGFASIRWRFNNIQNWSYAKGIYMKGLQHSNADEHTFRIILKDTVCERIRLSNFKAVFANPQQSDDPLLIPFSSITQMEQMGQPMVGAPAFNPSAVTEIGLMAIKPTVVGQFQLEFSEWGLYS